MFGFDFSILAKAPRGDLTLTGWVITFAYFVCAGLCVWAGRREKEEALGRARRWHAPAFWFTLAGLLVALGFNKQLDLQSDATAAGRNLFRMLGLYEYRRPFQFLFVMLFAAAAIAAVAGAIWFMKDLWHRYRLAFIGIIYLCAFVIIRAASFHHIDQLLYWSWAGGAVNTLLELGGNATIGFAAFRAATQKREDKYQVFERKVSVRR